MTIKLLCLNNFVAFAGVTCFYRCSTLHVPCGDIDSGAQVNDMEVLMGDIRVGANVICAL